MSPSLALDDAGEPVVAWMDRASGFWEIYVKRFDGASWVEVGAGSASGGGISAAAGLAVAIPAHACYNYLVSRINSIVLDMERSATEIVQIVTEGSKAPPAP